MPINNTMLKLQDITRVHVELTTRCNARCPMCPRNFAGYKFNRGYPTTELKYQDFTKIFPPTFLKQLVPPDPDYQWGVYLNGNLGDFAVASDAAEIVHYIVDQGVKVEINTNGSQRSSDWWAQLARPGVTIGFALDGLADTHHLYRQDTDWHKIIKNAQAYINAGGRAIWRFVPFDHNRHQEQECKNLAQSMGFHRFENIYDGRDKGFVFNKDGSFSHWIGQPESKLPNLERMLNYHGKWTAPIVPVRTDIKIDCWHKKNREIYVAADGSVYPCCFLGFYPETMVHQGNEKLKHLVKENNALQYDLAHCVEWFNQVEKTWSEQSIPQCVSHCGKKIV